MNGPTESLGSLVVNILGDTTGFEKSIARATSEATSATKSLLSLAGGFERAGASLMKGLTLPLTAVAGLSLKTFGSFEDSMARSAALFGDVSDGMRGRMEATARQISGASLSSADELAKTYGVLARAGFSAEQATSALASVERFAVANGLDAASAARTLADAQRVLGLRSDDAGKNTANLTKLQDELMETSLLSGASIEDLSAALEHGGADAMRRFNVPLERGLSLLTSFAQQGKKGYRAGAALAEYLEKHGAGTGGPLEALIGSSAGTSERAAKKILGTFSSELEILGNEARNAGEAVGKILAPYVREATGYVKDGLVWWEQLSGEQKKLAVGVGASVAALGPGVKILGALGLGTVSWVAATALVPVAIASATDALGFTNTGILHAIENTKLWGKTIKDQIRDAWELSASKIFDPAKAKRKDGPWTEAKDLEYLANMRKKDRDALLAQREAEANLKLIRDSDRADDAKEAKAEEERRGKAAKDADELIARATKGVVIPALDLENDKLKEQAKLRREAAQGFMSFARNQISVAGLAVSVPGVKSPAAAAPAGPVDPRTGRPLGRMGSSVPTADAERAAVGGMNAEAMLASVYRARKDRWNAQDFAPGVTFGGGSSFRPIVGATADEALAGSRLPAPTMAEAQAQGALNRAHDQERRDRQLLDAIKELTDTFRSRTLVATIGGR